MNKPNALNPGASSTPFVSAEADASTPAGQAGAATPAGQAQAYGNSLPGTAGNTPGARPAAAKEQVVPAMMQSTKSDSERGAVDPALTEKKPD